MNELSNRQLGILMVQFTSKHFLNFRKKNGIHTTVSMLSKNNNTANQYLLTVKKSGVDHFFFQRNASLLDVSQFAAFCLDDMTTDFELFEIQRYYDQLEKKPLKKSDSIMEAQPFFG